MIYDVSWLSFDVCKYSCLLLDFDLEKFTVENWKSCFEGKDVLFLAVGLVFAEARRLPGNTEVTAHTVLILIN